MFGRKKNKRSSGRKSTKRRRPKKYLLVFGDGNWEEVSNKDEVESIITDTIENGYEPPKLYERKRYHIGKKRY